MTFFKALFGQCSFRICGKNYCQYFIGQNILPSVALKSQHTNIFIGLIHSNILGKKLKKILPQKNPFLPQSQIVASTPQAPRSAY